MTISERLAETRAKIARAAERCGRSPNAIRLVAVSKTKPIEAIREAYAAGQRDFGENYVQELVAKAEALADLVDLRWHAIGHVQRNKVKKLVQHAAAIHSVDSIRLIGELNARAGEVPEARRLPAADARLPLLIEVNVGAEAQKTGCRPDQLSSLIGACDAAPALRLIGLMTMAPHTDNPEDARPYFDALRRLRDEHGGLARLPELSMGMTHDLEAAILAGATIVRVGTAIFGERPLPPQATENAKVED